MVTDYVIHVIRQLVSTSSSTNQHGFEGMLYGLNLHVRYMRSSMDAAVCVSDMKFV